MDDAKRKAQTTYNAASEYFAETPTLKGLEERAVAEVQTDVIHGTATKLA